eukprot:6824433-Pyramimonas_sp.AAC.1
MACIPSELVRPLKDGVPAAALATCQDHRGFAPVVQNVALVPAGATCLDPIPSCCRPLTFLLFHHLLH